MNYKFSNLLGAPYRGGTLLFNDQELLTPVGNRVSQVDLVNSTSQTPPVQNLKQIQTLAVHPHGRLLLSVDIEGKALLINKRRGAVLHHFSFKSPVRVARFSPDGAFLAAAVGKILEVWLTPSFEKQMNPMQLHRKYGGCHDDITTIGWSPESNFVAVGAKDLTVRIFSLHPIEGYQPALLTGHKDSLVGVFFTSQSTSEASALVEKSPVNLYTVSRDGALLGWTFRKTPGALPASLLDVPPETVVWAGGMWSLEDKNFFMQRSARVTAADYHQATGVLVVGLSNGVFELHQLPEFQMLHTLSISHLPITAMAFNAKGDWIAMGCADLGQLLVWEWRSETYVLKQQGHYFDIATASFSPDGALIATGADDNKVKIFQMSSGFCFVTFSDHTAPVTALQFLPAGQAVLSASLDGTVRAFDLVRYRNFRTMTTPTPVQFSSLAVDPAGEVVCAGSTDTFQIFVWSLKTGRLLDILAAHEGPVCGLAFSPTQSLLASCSWDHTVRTWDVFDNKGAVEVLQHTRDVLALAYRPDGKQLASATLDGQICFWNPDEGELQGTIEGRRDIKGGRLTSDRRAAGNLASDAHFTSLVYSADGSLLLAGGNSKYVCMYDVEERLLLRRFQISQNRSLDGVLDILNSKRMTDAGPLDLLDYDEEGDMGVVQGTSRAAVHNLPGNKEKKPVVRSRCVCLSPTGHSWAAATTEGLLVYSLDDSLTFDPTDLTESLTVDAFHQSLKSKSYLRALLIALRLKDAKLVETAIFSTPIQQVPVVVAGVPKAYILPLLSSFSDLLSTSPHVEFLLHWVNHLGTLHGPTVQQGGSQKGPILRGLLKTLNRLHADLGTSTENNLYMLEYLMASAG